MATESANFQHDYEVFWEEPVPSVHERRYSLEYGKQSLPLLSKEKDAETEKIYVDSEALHDLQDNIVDVESSRIKMDRHRRILHDARNCPSCRMYGEEYDGIWNDLLHDLHGCTYCKYNSKPKQVKETVHEQEVRKPRRGAYIVHDPRECSACKLRYNGQQHTPNPCYCSECRNYCLDHQRQSHPQPQPQPPHQPQPQRQLQMMQYPIRCEHCDGHAMYYRRHDVGNGKGYGQHDTCPYCYPYIIEKYPDYNRQLPESDYGYLRYHHNRHHGTRHHDKRRHSNE